ncbi:hypothetical protein C8Q77DRAFT_1070292 [Trametes polyzona]|nr:hypothetical protein C8Q77DRAFT_1070292 [Trametes polyzona]
MRIAPPSSTDEQDALHAHGGVQQRHQRPLSPSTVAPPRQNEMVHSQTEEYPRARNWTEQKHSVNTYRGSEVSLDREAKGVTCHDTHKELTDTATLDAADEQTLRIGKTLSFYVSVDSNSLGTPCNDNSHPTLLASACSSLLIPVYADRNMVPGSMTGLGDRTSSSESGLSNLSPASCSGDNQATHLPQLSVHASAAIPYSPQGGLADAEVPLRSPLASTSFDLPARGTQPSDTEAPPPGDLSLLPGSYATAHIDTDETRDTDDALCSAGPEPEAASRPAASEIGADDANHPPGAPTTRSISLAPSDASDMLVDDSQEAMAISHCSSIISHQTPSADCGDSDLPDETLAVSDADDYFRQSLDTLSPDVTTGTPGRICASSVNLSRCCSPAIALDYVQSDTIEDEAEPTSGSDLAVCSHLHLDEERPPVPDAAYGSHDVSGDLMIEPSFIPDLDYGLPPSSPPPSSSPPHIFSSSPPLRLDDSPPSSSPPFREMEACAPDGKTVGETKEDTREHGTAKRHAIATNCMEHNEEREMKRMKLEPGPAPSDAPLPKRLTQASVAKQRKKLAAPFRSPVIKGPLVQGGLHAVYATGRAAAPLPVRKPPVAEDVTEATARSTMDLLKPEPMVANKDRTAKAAKQFKSPLAAATTAAGPSTSATSDGTLFSSVRAAPTIQVLQGRLQTLKQAIRIKNTGRGGGEDELELLVDKWTAAGREVAWAVWDYVKDLDPGSSGSAGASTKGGWFADEGDAWSAKAGEKRGFDPSWGYDDEHSAKKARVDEGVDVEGPGAEEEDEDATPAVQHTLGTMLRHMGIDPATLGWDEEEGDFVDA